MSGTIQLKDPWDFINAVLPRLKSPAGQWTPFEAASALFDTVEIRTTATPPLVLQVSQMGVGEPNPIAKMLKPTVILRGPAGQKVIAPYGVVGAEEGRQRAYFLIGMTAVAALGVGFIAGRSSARVVRTRDIRKGEGVAGLDGGGRKRRRRTRRRRR